MVPRRPSMVHKAPNAREAPKPQRSQRLRRVLSRPRHKVVIRPLKCPPRSPYLKACSNATHGGLYTWPEQVIARPTAALCTADRRLIIIVGQHTLTLASLKPMAQSTSETTSRAVSGRSSAVGVSATITPKVGEPGAEHGSGCSSVPACSSA